MAVWANERMSACTSPGRLTNKSIPPTHYRLTSSNVIAFVTLSMNLISRTTHRCSIIRYVPNGTEFIHVRTQWKSLRHLTSFWVASGRVIGTTSRIDPLSFFFLFFCFCTSPSAKPGHMITTPISLKTLFGQPKLTPTTVPLPQQCPRTRQSSSYVLLKHTSWFSNYKGSYKWDSLLSASYSVVRYFFALLLSLFEPFI